MSEAVRLGSELIAPAVRPISLSTLCSEDLQLRTVCLAPVIGILYQSES